MNQRHTRFPDAQTPWERKAAKPVRTAKSSTKVLPGFPARVALWRHPAGGIHSPAGLLREKRASPSGLEPRGKEKAWHSSHRAAKHYSVRSRRMIREKE